MGANKALLDIAGHSVLSHVGRRLRPQVSDLVINAGNPLPGFETTVRVEDAVSGQLGPLAGILTGMKHFGPDHARFVTAPCDSPFLPSNLVDRLADAAGDGETIAMASSAGRNHPVFALWPTALAEDLEHWLSLDENRRIHAFIRRHRSVAVDFAAIRIEGRELDPFFNINTPEELAEAQTFAEALA